MLTNQMMRKGKIGMFGTIEREANLRNSGVFAILTLLLFAIAVLLYFKVPEIGRTTLFMWFSAAMLIPALVELLIVRRKNGVGNHLKWVIGISYVISAAITTSTLGSVGGILFAFPLLLSIQYCSMLYSVFVSVAAVMGAFIPLLLSAYLSSFDLNVVRFAPGTVIEIASTLEKSIYNVNIDEVATKINELLSTSLPLILLIIIISIVTVSITASVRRFLLEQYHQFLTTRE